MAVERSRPQIDMQACSLDVELKVITEIAQVLRVQAESLDPYFKQQILMREMLIRELETLEKRLALIRLFNSEAFTKRPSIAVAHHGTTWSRAREIQRLIAEHAIEPFIQSTSDGEWLGHGVYFWLMAPHRAATWGREIYAFQRRRRPWLPNLIDPGVADYVPIPDGQRSHFAVVEVRLRFFVETTINLLDQQWVDRVRQFYQTFVAKTRTIEDQARALSNYGYVNVTAADGTSRRSVAPQIDGPHRTRDCLFFNELVAKYPRAQSIVAAIREGEQLIDGMNFNEKDHVQVNVIDQSIIDLADVTVTDAADYFESLPVQTNSTGV